MIPFAHPLICISLSLLQAFPSSHCLHCIDHLYYFGVVVSYFYYLDHFGATHLLQSLCLIKEYHAGFHAQHVLCLLLTMFSCIWMCDVFGSSTLHCLKFLCWCYQLYFFLFIVSYLVVICMGNMASPKYSMAYLMP